MRVFRFFVLLVLVILVSNFPNLAHADKYANTIEVFKKSPAVQPFFGDAYGYVVFPTVGKGGMGIGGAYGKGQVYRGGKVTGTAKLFKATIGFQLGGQAFKEIIFFEDKRAYDDFTSGEFEFDAAASAVHSCGRPKGQCHCSRTGQDTPLSRHAPPDDISDVRLAPDTISPPCTSRCGTSKTS